MREPRPAGPRLSSWLAAALLLALAPAGAARAAETAGAWVLRQPPATPFAATARAALPRPLPSALVARLEARRAAIAAGRFTGDALVRPGASFGIRHRVDGRWLPARGATSRHAEILRRGDAQDLALGELARAVAPEAAAAGVASVPGQDTVRMLVLRVDFLTDRSGTQSTGDGRFDQSPPDTVNAPFDPTPHNRAFYDAHLQALARYYYAATAGRLVLQWDIYPHADSAYHTTDMADFGPWRLSQDVFGEAYRMFRYFLAAADTQDTSIPWASFDRVMIFHAGSDLQSDVKQDSPNDIPTFTIGLDDSLAIPVADSSTRIYASAILPETANQDGYFAVLNGVVAHESGHNIFGWRDVYDVNSGFPVCGEWTLMDTGNQVGYPLAVGDSASARTFYVIGLLPPLADPYQRHLVYDDVPREDPADWGGLDSLRSPLVDPRAVRVPLDSEEYLLLENRHADLNGDGQLELRRDRPTGVILGPAPKDSLEYDFLLPGEGILVWHVDGSVVDFDPPGRRADAYYSINGDARRRGLTVIEADGLQDLGDFNSPYALGSPFDPYFVPNNGRLAPTGTRPRLVTNSGTNPHVAIDVPDTVRFTMRVRASHDWTLAGWPVVARPAAHGLDPLVFDFDPGPGTLRRVVYAAGDSAIHARAADGAPAGGVGDVLWRAPASVSRVAALGDPLAAAPIVAVYPDPANVRDSTWSTDGSAVVALDASGDPLPGFPVRLPRAADGAPDWITAGPLVFDPLDTSPGQPVIVVGTRSGRVYAVSPTGGVGEIGGYWLPVQGGGLTAGVPVLALSSFTRAPRALLAAADSLGDVAVRTESALPAAAASAAAEPAPGGAAGSGAWDPLLAWVEMNAGAGGRLQRDLGPAPSTPDIPQLVVVNRLDGSGSIYSGANRWAELRGVNAPLARGLAAGDLDGDGFNEIVLLTEDGRVGFWNLSGSSLTGWPRDLDPEPFTTLAAPLVTAVAGTAAPAVVVATGSGRLDALGRDRKVPEGWPLATAAGQYATPALQDVDGDGSLELLIADPDSLLYAFAPPAIPAAGAVWPLWGHDAARTASLPLAPADTAAATGSGLVQGAIACYPNPAERQAVTVSYRLNAPAAVTLTLFDPSGRQVAEVRQDALASDNALIWDPAGQAPGLYLGRLVIQGAGRREHHLLHIGILR